MATQKQYTFNGVLSTDKTVLQNLDILTEACNSFLTFDINTGKWCVIINRPGESVKSFNNTNILGSISVSGTGLNDFYNKVVVEFPHKDLLDQTDAIVATIDSTDFYPNEKLNVLNLKYDIINDPIQASLLGTIKLKQSRVDKIIKFQTDFTSLGLKAGDIIDVTSDVYAYTSKLFRVISIEEEDTDEGAIVLGITALEYDANVYNTDGLHRVLRTPVTGITQKVLNESITANDEEAAFGSVWDQILALAGTSLFNAMFPGINKKIMDALNKTPPCTVTLTPTSVCEGAKITATAKYCNAGCTDFDGIKIPYTITGVDAADINVPLTGEMEVKNGTATLEITTTEDANIEGIETLTFKAEGVEKTAEIKDKLSFTYQTAANPASITEGESSTVTLTTTGVPDGTSVPYTITGSATGKVTTPLSGNVTVSGNTASLVINTTDDAVYTGTQGLTITFNSSQEDPCGQLDKTAAISVLDNDPAPPTPPADYSCNPKTIPAVWCGVADGTTGQIKALTVQKYIQVCSPVPGQAKVTVPLTVSVTPGNPSTVTVTSTVEVSGLLTSGGSEWNIITTFDSLPSGQTVVTGTSTKVIGY